MSTPRARPRLTAGPLLLLLAAAPLAAQTVPPDSADAHYRAGRAILEGGDSRVPAPWGLLDALTIWEDLKGLVGRGYLDRAWSEFERALELEPGHAGAATGLAELAVGSAERQHVERAAEALAVAAARPTAPREVWLWRARVGALLRDPDAAAWAARYGELGGDAGLAALAEARAWLAAGRDSLGAAAYLRGLERPSQVAADAYFGDLGPIVRERELLAWGASGRRAPGPWLRRFWERRGAEAGMQPEERIAEHYRRLDVALRHFRRTGRRDVTLEVADPAASDPVLGRGRDLGLDDRGVIHLLHGEPDRRVSTVPCAPNESWLYRRPEGDLLFHFHAASGQQLVLTGDPAARCETLDDAVAVYEDRALLDPRMGLMAARLRELSALSPLAAGRSARESELRLDRLALESEMRMEALEALERDTWAPDLGRPMEFYYDAFAFRGRDGATRLVFAVAVPGEQLPLERTPGGGARYPLELALSVFDAEGGAVFQADSAPTYSAPVPLSAGENLRTALELSVPPGDYQHRVTLRAAGREPAGGVYGGPMEVLDFRGDTLAISDLVLAEVGGGGWRRGGVELGLVPPRQFARGDVITLFYELYNPPPNGEIRTRIEVEPVEGGGVLRWLGRIFGAGRGTVSLDFADRAHAGPDGAAAVVRTVDLAGLEAGAYRIRVRVGAGFADVVRAREFLIRER